MSGSSRSSELLLLKLDRLYLQYIAADSAYHFGFEVFVFGEFFQRGQRAGVAGFVEFEKLAIGRDHAVTAAGAGDGAFTRVAGEILVAAHHVHDRSGEGFG